MILFLLLIKLSTMTTAILENQHVCSLLLQIYGMNVDKMRRMGGFSDYNFLIKCNGRKYIVKISNAKQDLESLNIQNFVLSSLVTIRSKNLEQVDLPELQPCRKGEFMHQIEINGQNCALRVYNFIEGITLWDMKFIPDRVYEQIGKITAELSNNLAQITLNSEIMPIVKNSKIEEQRLSLTNFPNLFKAYFNYLKDEETKKLMTNIFNEYKKIQNTLLSIPKQMVHNDICNSNVILSQDPEVDVKGIIDFCNLTYTHKISQVVIPCARISLEEGNPLKYIKLVLKGYLSVNKLDENEKKVIYPLIKVRLACLSLLSNYQYFLNDWNQYLLRCRDEHFIYLKHISRACTNKQFEEMIEKQLMGQ